MASKKHALDNLVKVNEKAQQSISVKYLLFYLIDVINIYQTEFTTIIASTQQEKATDTSDLKQIEVKVHAKQKEIYTELKLYREKNNLGNISSDLEGLLHPDPKNRIDSTQPILEIHRAIYNEFQYLINISSDHIPFLSKFATIACRIQDKHFSFMMGFCPADKFLHNLFLEYTCEDIDKWQKAKQNLELQQHDKTWYHWDIIIGIYNVYMCGEKIHKELIDAGHFFEAYKVSALYNRLHSALSSTNAQNDDSYGFDLSSLKYSLQKIVDNALTKSEDLAILKKEHKKYVSFTMRGTVATVRYGTKEAAFSTKDRTGNFIKAFSKNPEEPIEYSLLWAKTVGGSKEDFGGKEEKQLEETRKSVNKQLRKIGLFKAYEKTKSKKSDIDLKPKKMWLNSKYSVQK